MTDERFEFKLQFAVWHCLCNNIPHSRQMAEGLLETVLAVETNMSGDVTVGVAGMDSANFTGETLK